MDAVSATASAPVHAVSGAVASASQSEFAQADSSSKPPPRAPSSQSTTTSTSRARATFRAHASGLLDGEPHMTQDDFVKAIAPANENYHKIARESYAVLFSVADRKHRGLVSFQDWEFFENLLQKPDAEYEIAFRLFDTDGNGVVDYDEFIDYYNKNKSDDSIPFDWNCDWVTLYIGDKKKRHSMTYPQFAQMLRGLQGERVRQAFHFYDRANTGYIEPEQFQKIIEKTAKHKLSDRLLASLQTLCNISTSSKISYANVRAFQNVIRETDMVDVIVKNACAKSPDGTITRLDFMNEAARSTKFSLFTPMEIDVLFHFASLDNNTGRLSRDDFRRVLDPTWQDPVTLYTLAQAEKVEAAKHAFQHPGHFLSEVFESAYHFLLGSVAGALGATIVYPIDLVKTRMQNQRSKIPGQLLYKNSWDCFRKVIHREGFAGLYSGLGPQLVGVAPEKAIKLTVNDFARGKFTDDDGKITILGEIISGGSAGACQVVFTNPLEIVKIRLQIQGEVAKSIEGAPKRSAVWIVRNLGLLGLYRGATACLMRDVPFSAIYFPTYAHLKKDYFGEGPNKTLGIGQLLVAGAIAGMPAAYFTTPCDVIKTRLQAEARVGQTHYRNIAHCATTIWREEGFKAFFKGGPARIMRSSPQFGCTLAAYELLQSLLPLHVGGKTEAGHSIPSGEVKEVPPEKRQVEYLRSRNALKILLDIDENFGKPKVSQLKESWKLVPGFNAK
ncbi:mitochondrial carrier domain-containing protein [Lipomyces chichibuensis]|uniref:mitochondrial carrier domain-containing protein n=1 Tax=Lipomyces chichibuensis TaxID=1546026 RepID=UPI0033433E86